MEPLKNWLHSVWIEPLKLLDLLESLELRLSVNLDCLDEPISVLLLLFLLGVWSIAIRSNCCTNVALKESTLAVIEKLIDFVSLHKLFQFDLLKVSLVLVGIFAWSDSVCANRWSICILSQIWGLIHIGARFVAFVFGATILAHKIVPPGYLTFNE